MPFQNQFLSCKDYLVSGEEFQLLADEKTEVLKTEPVPENLQQYYKSENYISHSDSRKSLSDKIYGGVKKYMLQKKISWIQEYFPKAKILDVGAGTGDFLIEAKKQNFEIYGIEPGREARKRAEEKGLQLFEKLEMLTQDNFDVISLWHVLEHLPDPEAEILNFKRLLKQNGILVIAVPNFKSYDAKKYKEFWAAYDVPRHLWHFSQNGLKSLLQKNGFELLKTRPLIFDAYYVSLLSEKYKTGKTNLPVAFLNGWKSNRKAKQTSEYSSLVYFFKKS
ncbi:class I SAM-dependent methyltransferase [Salegentibacter sp. HM20]